jgi:hypothetical protein
VCLSDLPLRCLCQTLERELKAFLVQPLRRDFLAQALNDNPHGICYWSQALALNKTDDAWCAQNFID